MNYFYDPLTELWDEALDATTDLVRAATGGTLDRDRVRLLIETAHISDDPDWVFNGDRLVESLLEDDEWPDGLYEELESLFPVMS